MELKATDLTIDDGIATIWLNRPQRMNAWTGRMHTEYRWCLQEAESADAVRAIGITGKGRSFCVGGDSQALEGHAKKGGYDPGTPAELAKPGYGHSNEFDASFAYHFGLSKPVIAAMNGPAAGVGTPSRRTRLGLLPPRPWPRGPDLARPALSGRTQLLGARRGVR